MVNDVTVEYEPPVTGKLIVAVDLVERPPLRFRSWPDKWRGDVAALRHAADLMEQHAQEQGWPGT